MHHGRRFKPVDWGWLDEVEEAIWGDEKPEGEEVPPERSQRNLLALARAGKLVPQTPN